MHRLLTSCKQIALIRSCTPSLRDWQQARTRFLVFPVMKFVVLHRQLHFTQSAGLGLW